MVEKLVFKATSAENFHNINIGKTELIYFPENTTHFQSWQILSKICVYVIIQQHDGLFLTFLKSGSSSCSPKTTVISQPRAVL
jgi:hypothetical protein